MNRRDLIKNLAMGTVAVGLGIAAKPVLAVGNDPFVDPFAPDAKYPLEFRVFMKRRKGPGEDPIPLGTTPTANFLVQELVDSPAGEYMRRPIRSVIRDEGEYMTQTAQFHAMASAFSPEYVYADSPLGAIMDAVNAHRQRRQRLGADIVGCEIWFKDVNPKVPNPNWYMCVIMKDGDMGIFMQHDDHAPTITAKRGYPVQVRFS